jgi:hypothetical protein
VRENAAVAVRDLQRNAADGTGDDRLALPERLADGQPKTFLERLLQHDGRRALQRVDLDVGGRGEIEDVNIGIAVGRFVHGGENLFALGIVAPPAAPGDSRCSAAPGETPGSPRPDP